MQQVTSNQIIYTTCGGNYDISIYSTMFLRKIKPISALITLML